MGWAVVLLPTCRHRARADDSGTSTARSRATSRSPNPAVAALLITCTTAVTSPLSREGAARTL